MPFLAGAAFLIIAGYAMLVKINFLLLGKVQKMAVPSLIFLSFHYFWLQQAEERKDKVEVTTKKNPLCADRKS